MTVGNYVGSVYDGAVSITDKYGHRLTPSDEVAEIRRSGVRESDEFAEIGPENFDSLEEYQLWVMNGRRQFLCAP